VGMERGKHGDEWKPGGTMLGEKDGMRKFYFNARPVKHPKKKMEQYAKTWGAPKEWRTGRWGGKGQAVVQLGPEIQPEV